MQLLGYRYPSLPCVYRTEYLATGIVYQYSTGVAIKVPRRWQNSDHNYYYYYYYHMQHSNRVVGTNVTIRVD